jgi:DNA-binding response OmpR family regulator
MSFSRYEVSVAPDEVGALAQARDFSPAVVLLDVNLRNTSSSNDDDDDDDDREE